MITVYLQRKEKFTFELAYWRLPSSVIMVHHISSTEFRSGIGVRTASSVIMVLVQDIFPSLAGHLMDC